MRKKKKYLVISFLLAVPLFLGLYLNYLLNNLVNGLYIPLIPIPIVSPVVPPAAEPGPSPDTVGEHDNAAGTGEVSGKIANGQGKTTPEDSSGLPSLLEEGKTGSDLFLAGSDLTTTENKTTASNNSNTSKRTQPSPSKPGDNSGGNSHDNDSSSPPPSNNTQQIISDVQEQIEKPLEKKDLLKAGMLILQKLSWEEINFLYSVGTKEQRSVEEQKQTREILLKKLDAEEIAVLRELGTKYGKKLNILDPNVPIR
ncbi:MAG: hypothetical protein PHP87_10000 [Syntrophomonas sp.]|uniref:hypothetical protein n=1 Tax=Syntrophomonas sp. TaxID=2053627 RepID=UPI002603BD80|nr:hypothetical protein [Syntrophomonas sp.]MDD4627394.1 hypothetical protein [Syntrophomonas sp.]